MDYEKKYNDLVNDLKELWNCHTNDSQLLGELTEIFPELAESEDERIRTVLCDIVRDMPYMETELRAHGLSVEKTIAYLEKQKDSVSNAKYIEDVAHAFEDGRKKGIGEFLSNLRPQPKKELSIEKAIQWLDDTFYFLDNSSGQGRDCEITTHDFDSLEEMYDSFRKAVIVDSEPHWKPSEEQMNALNALNCHGDLSYVGQQNQLISLYNDLKKLM